MSDTTTPDPRPIPVAGDMLVPSTAVKAGEAFTVESVNRLQVEHGELEVIVRDLAASDPLVDVMTDVDASVIGCALCKERGGESSGNYDPEHAEACTFARSAAWVSAHPVSGDPPEEASDDDRS